MKISLILPISALALCCGLLTACNERTTVTALASPTPAPMPPALETSPAATATPTTPTTPAQSPTTATTSPGPLKAEANLSPTEGNNVHGTVTFTEAADGVKVEANITGLTPGKHGFHVHEKGDCSAPDGSSAGDHFNPTGMPHAAPDQLKRHDGDMGNIEADAAGVAKLSYVDHTLSLAPGDRSVIGHAVIVHANPDDLTSQPSGNAGARLACGVIEKTGGTP